MLHCVAVCCSADAGVNDILEIVLQCVAVRCSALQCVAVCCSAEAGAKDKLEVGYRACLSVC